MRNFKLTPQKEINFLKNNSMINAQLSNDEPEFL